MCLLCLLTISDRDRILPSFEDMSFQDMVSHSEVYASFLVFLLRSRQQPVDGFPVILQDNEDKLLRMIHNHATRGSDCTTEMFALARRLMKNYDSSVYPREVDTPMVRFLIVFSLKNKQEFDAPSVVAKSIQSLLWCMRFILADFCMSDPEKNET